MTRINTTGNTGPQQIPSQDSGVQRVSKPETQKAQQEPNAAEQQQGKQAAQGRKSDIDLQGSIKQAQLAQFHGPGGGGLIGGPLGGGSGQGNQPDNGTGPDAISGAAMIAPERKFIQ